MAFGARGRVDGWIAGGGCGGCGVVLVCGGGVVFCVFFFFNDTATTEIYTLSLHDALPISEARGNPRRGRRLAHGEAASMRPRAEEIGRAHV